MAEAQPQSPTKDLKPAEEQPKSPEKEAEHHHDDKSDSSSEGEHHHHEHGHDHAGHDHHGHDHDHEHDKGDGKKSSRGEKKFKKAMTKLGMKPVPGINRVTIKKAKSLLLYIDDPEILKNPGSDNSYIIFGEAKILDFPGNVANEEASKFKKPEKPEDFEKLKQAAGLIEEKPASTEEKKPEVQVEEGEVSEEGLDPETIKMVQEHCKCTRQAAVKALRKTNGDSVNAILELS